MKSPGVPYGRSARALAQAVGVKPSPQSIVAVYELIRSGSMNSPASVIVSPSLAVVSDKFRSGELNCGVTLFTATFANAYPAISFWSVTEPMIV